MFTYLAVVNGTFYIKPFLSFGTSPTSFKFTCLRGDKTDREKLQCFTQHHITLLEQPQCPNHQTSTFTTTTKISFIQPLSVRHLSDQKWQLLSGYHPKPKCVNVKKNLLCTSVPWAKSSISFTSGQIFYYRKFTDGCCISLSAWKNKTSSCICNAKQHFCTSSKVHLRMNVYWYFNCTLLGFLITKCLYSIHNNIQSESVSSIPKNGCEAKWGRKGKTSAQHVTLLVIVVL